MNTKSKTLLAGIVATSLLVPVFADSEGTHDEPMRPANGMNMPGQGMMMNGPQGGMPMMRGRQGGMPPMMQMMQQKQAMMQQHMQVVEGRLANIEALLKELVSLQKR
jgi:hypothetical protein